VRKYLRDMEVKPCTECEVCNDTGVCIFDDDYQDVFNMLPEIDAMIVASPIFFYGVTAITKAFIDRSQQLYAKKYLLGIGKDIPKEEKKRGYFLSVGATMGKSIFVGPEFNMKYFYDALNFNFAGSILFKGIDTKGAARDHTDVLKECYEAGRKAAGGA